MRTHSLFPPVGLMILCCLFTDFTKNVDTSKDEAERAKERIPEIRTMIYEADKLTQQNRAALYGAKEAASRSLDDAEEAKNIAEKAAEV